ncbi:MAG TPA: hypothetical protein VG871_20115 [Vicinamibacterales bacterium]|nr:hypothetical protein [Vicinamibacterales bacterium]
MYVPRTAALVAAAAIAAASATGAPAKDPPIDLQGLLGRVGERVEAYYQRAQSIVCTEIVRLQSMSNDFSSSDPHVRRLEYELRVSWDKSDNGEAPDANVLRTLKTIDGRPPKPGQEPGCLDPKPVSLDPLSFLLPQHQHEYTFTYKGIGKAGDGRTGVMIDYVPAGKPPARVEWHDSCVSIDVPQQTRGRVWIDRFGGDVLRIDETVFGPYDIRVPDDQQRNGAGPYLRLDRADSSIRYRPVTFTDPDEIVLLPSSIEMMTVIRGSGSPRLRTTQTFTNYQRFVTGGHLVSQ